MKIRWKRLFKQAFKGKLIRITCGEFKWQAVLISGDKINLERERGQPPILFEIL